MKSTKKFGKIFLKFIKIKNQSTQLQKMNDGNSFMGVSLRFATGRAASGFAFASAILLPFSQKAVPSPSHPSRLITPPIKNLLLVFLFILFFSPLLSQNLSIIVPQELQNHPNISITLSDFKNLITKIKNIKIIDNPKNADYTIVINSLKNNDFTPLPSNIFLSPTPNQSFTWDFSEPTQWKLTAYSPEGITYGLYALLQEKLHFYFYHPKNTQIPTQLNTETLQGIWNVQPYFNKRGFHLHTQHPIELTDPLHDPDTYGGMQEVQEYLDWLVRNGQNYFDFCLLRTVNLKKWIPYYQKIVEYGHARGILMGLDLSLHMLQQKSFQLYKNPLQSTPKKKKEIQKNLELLKTLNLDYLNVEHEAAEFLGSNQAEREELRLFIIDWLQKNAPNTYLIGRQHVIKDEKESFQNKRSFSWTDSTRALDAKRGLLVHTVMFYDLTEQKAPVYENLNQRHMYELLLKEKKVREVWYYPESAYWITFDNSIPMLLLPYLSARLKDIDTCILHQVEGHITFSSGWEWGYWLIDWSIARWSWNYQDSQRTPSMYYEQWVNNPQKTEIFQQYLHIQNHYLKEKNLIQWLTAMTPTDESAFFNKQFHPRPPYSYKFLQNRAWIWIIDSLLENTIPLLNEYAEKIDSLYESNTYLNEIDWGVQITALRALHKASILNYILKYRKNKLVRPQKQTIKHYLTEADSIRQKALELVRLQEKNYRYDYKRLATKRWDYTAYHFGYLYTTANLHFWIREEKQAKKNWYSPFYKNVWNIFRIVGIW
ncbi:MAG: hypothetical protein KatS3mg035_1643 [Bacteroidia bacterium]|nr:MAG: hypothetical protein KatS3mg035_1643 [Bacteroidia bacterium]